MKTWTRAGLIATWLLLLVTNVGAMTCAPYYGQNYKEDFNSLATSGTSSTLPLGWGFIEQGPSANTTYTAGDGSSATLDTFSFGTNADRALGEVNASISVFRSTIGVCLINATGAAIQSFDFGFRVELWRHPGGTCAESRSVQYNMNATALDTVSGWAAIPGLDYAGYVSGLAGARDGNAEYVTMGPVTFSPPGEWLPGSTLFIRWLPTPAILGGCNGIGVGYDDVTLTTKKCRLDIDGNGSIDALTDGLILLRAMFGLTGNAVTNSALAANANRPNWAAIRGYLNDSCETNFAP